MASFVRRLRRARPAEWLVWLGWCAIAGLVGLLATELIGVTGNRYVAIVQSLAPYLLAAAFPLGAGAMVGRRWWMAAASLVIGVVFVALAWPLLHPASQPAVAAGAEPLRVFHSNLLYRNTDTDAIVRAVEGVDAEVLTFTEYTPLHAAALLASPLAEAYPYRIEHPDDDAHGAALWSRYPVTALDAPPSRATSILAVVAAPDPVTVYVVHTTSPLVSDGAWKAELRRLETRPAGADGPTMVIGDLNASYWHPEFRTLLDRGWHDAHELMGAGFSTSWPNDVGPVPPFVRLDHALVDDELVVLDVDDVHMPGSDHVALVATVARAA